MASQHVWVGARSARQDQAKGVEYVLVGTRGAWQEQAAAAASGRIMSSLANHGGLAGSGGIAGKGGGLAG